ncbi:MAG: two-component sensor histidine kinase, partial [Alphaproteobacteria bacterium]|nr:two-component sensor histidine kinase [Alphaproteobacteria bacterium]
EGIGEIGTLTKAFNDMTDQISVQREGLMAANRELDERRRFTETVLAGVSAGVIGLDPEGRINLPNRSASLLLDTDLLAKFDRYLAEIVPEMAEVLAEAMDRNDRPARAEITLHRSSGTHTLIVSAAAEKLHDDVIGYVVTFDDITELQSAQRKAAWSGVARRIAHEIKNPLTPIQLAAERLKRKYLKQIREDADTFATLTDTIVRQVEDLGRMVDEFSAFSRMPQAVLAPENMTDICRESLFLEGNRDHRIRFESDIPDGPVCLQCDRQQVSRALTNLLKNAAESVTEHLDATSGGQGEGWIRLCLFGVSTSSGERISIVVEDNGKGLPEADLSRLTEPYVTTREKGTGLGLAIVKKIMEDHGGDLILENRPEGGARITLAFAPQDVSQMDCAKRPGRKDG